MMNKAEKKAMLLADLRRARQDIIRAAKQFPPEYVNTEFIGSWSIQDQSLAGSRKEG